MATVLHTRTDALEATESAHKPTIRRLFREILTGGDVAVFDEIWFGADGRVRETWLEFDQLGGMQQMGVFPPDGLGRFRRVLFTLASIPRLALLEIRYSLLGARGAA